MLRFWTVDLIIPLAALARAALSPSCIQLIIGLALHLLHHLCSDKQYIRVSRRTTGEVGEHRGAVQHCPLPVQRRGREDGGDCGAAGPVGHPAGQAEDWQDQRVYRHASHVEECA